MATTLTRFSQYDSVSATLVERLPWQISSALALGFNVTLSSSSACAVDEVFVERALCCIGSSFFLRECLFCGIFR